MHPCISLSKFLIRCYELMVYGSNVQSNVQSKLSFKITFLYELPLLCRSTFHAKNLLIFYLTCPSFYVVQDALYRINFVPVHHRINIIPRDDKQRTQRSS